MISSFFLTNSGVYPVVPAVCSFASFLFSADTLSGKIISFRNASFLPMSLAIKPTRRAAITVPSLIPDSLSVAIFP